MSSARTVRAPDGRQNPPMRTSRPALHAPPLRGRRAVLLLAMAAASGALAQGDGDAALRAAAERNDLAAFRRLLAAGANVNAADAQKDTAFLIAARNGHADIVRAALSAGADLKTLNRYGSTALMGPAYRGHVDTVRALLEARIDLHHVNRFGWTALLEAIVLGQDGPAHREIVRMLVAAGSDVNARDPQGVSALQHAQQRGQSEVVRLLRAAGAR